MKKWIIVWVFIVFLGLFTACNSLDTRDLNEKNSWKENLVWGNCEYKTYSGSCEIISIEKNENLNIVKYKYSSKDSFTKKYEDRVYTLTLANWEKLSNVFVEKYWIKTWKVYNCSMNVEVKWTCSPIVINLDGIDTTDYKTK